MSKNMIAFLGVAMGIALYAPIGMHFFEVSISTMFDRAYFTLGGVAIALYAAR